MVTYYHVFSGYWHRSLVVTSRLLAVEEFIMETGEISGGNHYTYGGWFWGDCMVGAINTLNLRQKGCHLTDSNFEFILLYENCCILIKISQKLVPKCPVYNKQALVQIMMWHQTGDKPSSEPMVAYFSDVYMWHSVNESKSCHAEFVLGNMKIYLHVLSFCNTDMVLLVEIHAHGRRRPTHFSCKVNIRDADDLETQGARTSAAMVLT